jgi:hypothetical protein
VDLLAHAGGAAGQIDSPNLLRPDTYPAAKRRVLFLAKRRVLFLIFDQVLLVDKGKSRNVFYGFEIRRFYPGVIKPLPLEITFMIGVFKRLRCFFQTADFSGRPGTTSPVLSKNNDCPW